MFPPTVDQSASGQNDVSMRIVLRIPEWSGSRLSGVARYLGSSGRTTATTRTASHQTHNRPANTVPKENHGNVLQIYRDPPAGCPTVLISPLG
jgi:hypothetical protein